MLYDVSVTFKVEADSQEAAWNKLTNRLEEICKVAWIVSAGLLV